MGDASGDYTAESNSTPPMVLEVNMELEMDTKTNRDLVSGKRNEYHL